MAISLSDLKSVQATEPPRLLIYGPEGMGKTTLASEAPNVVFLQVESGTPMGVTLNSFGLLQSFAEVMEAITSLYTGEHAFEYVAVDSVSRLEPLIFAQVCADNNWKQIEDAGYGKGYAAADYVWQDFIDGLNALRRDRNMGVILIAHSETVRFDDPTSQSYSRYDIDLHKRSRAMIAREVDAILLVKQDVVLVDEKKSPNAKEVVRRVGQGNNLRWIYAEGRPAFTAKNRYGMPEKFAFEKGQGWTQLSKYFPPRSQPTAQPAQTETQPETQPEAVPA